MWYLIIFFIIQLLGLGILLAKHGEPKTGNYNFFGTFLLWLFELWLLYKAGCFDKYI